MTPSGADRDESKLAIAELLGEFGGRIDAWLLAEGVETWSELDAFQRLRVPLAQGYLFGRPAAPWAQLDEQTVARLRVGAVRAQLVEHVASLVETVPDAGNTLVPPGWTGLRVDRLGRPAALVLPMHRLEDGAEGHRVTAVTLRVSAATPVVELARRIATRPVASRFDPVVCVDDVGRALGIIRVERVLLRLAQLKTGPGQAER